MPEFRETRAVGFHNPFNAYPEGCVRSMSDAREMLITDGYTIVSDAVPDCGFDPGFGEYALSRYFGPEGILEPETYNVAPFNRLRARGVVAVEYSLDGRSVTLTDCDDDTISGKEYHPEARRYKLTPLLGDPHVENYIRSILNVLPRPVSTENRAGPWGSVNLLRDFTQFMLAGEPGLPATPRLDGTYYGNVDMGWSDQIDRYMDDFLRLCKAGQRAIVGVNFFKVFDDVVSDFHQDGVDFAIVDRLARQGDGATTALRAVGSRNPTVDIGSLQPGYKAIFDDRLVSHKTEGLIPRAGEDTFACSIVTTVDFESKLSTRMLECMIMAAHEIAQNQNNIPWIDVVMEVATEMARPGADSNLTLQSYVSQLPYSPYSFRLSSTNI